ncbi:MAG: tripartite tricarboxylate transporter substrate binding protein, partial [Burkholderiaceae bacterium]|nr:tripartite tricarboxylate transporter substrate binding protein [Burkholderiaceae bacterium]
MKYITRTLVAAIAATAAFAAGAQGTYPNKTVRIVVPYVPGGTVDLVARVLAQRLTEQTGQQFIVDNRAGASGAIGSDAVAKAPADGYTLLVQSPTLIANPLMVKTTPYDVIRDFTPIALMGSVPMVMTVNAAVPATNLKELIAAARANPKQYAFGTSAIGSPMHVALEAIKHDAKLEVPVIGYKGTAAALNDVLGGQISAIIDAIPSSAQHIASGKLRAIAVTTKERVASLPNVPTVAEQGMPEFEMSSWYGLWGPARLPDDVTKKLAAEVAKAMKSPL